MMQLLLATNNKNKRIEFEALMPKHIQLLTLDEVSITEELPENEQTIEGNSLSKAKYAFEHSNIACIAEDTGLEVEALNNEPGVYSARYAGNSATSEENIDLLLANLNTINNRSARFKTIITYYEKGCFKQFEGITNGKIAFSRNGGNGFGYDSVFIPEGYDQTFAEMTFEEKNLLSHRKKAIVMFLSYYLNNL